MANKFFLTCSLFIITIFLSSGQKITYSQPERDDVRSVDFDIVGKINNHYLVYKRKKKKRKKKKIHFFFFLGGLINSQIIPYKDYFYFVYQFQKRNIVNC